MSFGEKLAKYFNGHEMDQKELAKILGVREQTISAYITKKNNPTYDRFMEICNKLEVDANYFMDDELKNKLSKEVTSKELSTEDKHILTRYHNLPPNNKSIVDYIFGMEEEEVDLPDNTVHLLDMGELTSIDTYIEKVSAGNGNTTVTGQKVSKLYPTTKVSSKATYAARITGDSMEPRFIDNDIIYVNDNRVPGHGDIGVFTYNGETYCKEYYAMDGVEKLISLNDSYKPIIIDKTLQFEKQGVVIGKFHAD